MFKGMVTVKKKILIPIFGGIFAFVFCFVLATGIQPDSNPNTFDAPSNNSYTKVLKNQFQPTDACVAELNDVNLSRLSSNNNNPVTIPNNPKESIAPENDYIVVGGVFRNQVIMH